MEGRGVRTFRAMMIAVCFIFTPMLAIAADDVTQLQQTITEKKAEISALNARLDQYKAKIRELAGKGASLHNDIALLENEIAMSELDIAATQNTLDQETLELRIIDDQMTQVAEELAQRRAMLSDVLFAMNKTDAQGVFDVVLRIGSVGDVFDAAQQLASVNATMKSALEASKRTQQQLRDRQAEHETTVATLATIQRELTVKTNDLDLRRNAKLVLAEATSESENEYRTLMSEIRSEQQAIANEVASLQDDVQSKLQSREGYEANTSFIWPVHGVLTALFHDPSYPFRNLFEHAGVDIAVPQGTAIQAAAPGFVARVYKGQDYGYYILIIHANGFATLYAHMSRIDVELDQYVARGQIVGLSGGRPGTVGAGFSTGPHTHFEVRLNGIPVNPLAYLDRDLL